MKRAYDMRRVMRGELTPHPDSRLGAFAATSGYPPGSVGNTVNKAIGTLYLQFGTYGQERIGTVFNSPDAKKLYCDSIQSDSSKKIAQMEFDYWKSVRTEDPYSQGAFVATQFDPDVRDQLQKRVFASAPDQRSDNVCRATPTHAPLSDIPQRRYDGARAPRATSGSNPNDTHSPLSADARRRARHGPTRNGDTPAPQPRATSAGGDGPRPAGPR